MLPVSITENYAVLLQSIHALSVDYLPFLKNFIYIIEQNIPNKCRMVIKPTTAPIIIPVTLIASIAAADSPPVPAVAERESYNQCKIYMCNSNQNLAVQPAHYADAGSDQH